MTADQRGARPARTVASIVAVGSELLDGDHQDTNSLWLARRLWDLGAAVESIAVVPDHEEAIASAVAAGPEGSIVVLCGGIGPTQDDRTREGIARAAGRSLAEHPAAVELIRGRMRSLGREASSDQLRQALLPEGAEPLANPVGIAPGVFLRAGGRIIAALPGVPSELKAMFDEFLAPLLGKEFDTVLVRRVLKVAGRTESAVDAAVRELLAQVPGGWTILAKEQGIEIVLRARGSSREEALGRLAPFEASVRERLGADVYGGAPDTPASAVGELLSDRGATVACAESCTGGLVAAAMTDVPGSSGWFRGGLVTYSNELKRSLAGVSEELLERHGAVSEPVALALAAGACAACGADYGIGVTGIAGPGGATPGKPVGLVHVAVAGPHGSRAWNRRFLGDRDAIRRRTVTSALDGLRRVLLGLP